MSLHVTVVSPEAVLYEGEAEMVVCRPSDGELAFLPGHELFVGALGGYPVRVIRGADEPELAMAVHGGFVEFSDDSVTVLSDVAELPDQIDVARASASAASASWASAANRRSACSLATSARANLRLEAARGTPTLSP